ncbi:MAG: polymerase beta domain protein region protein [candidate division TM6 bacterium GW2011_GWF2_37_49]|nr:MAG: polymerase beta domain protein region protein [candidate division TM6 bacterium GW2011_GWF2_37_49]
MNDLDKIILINIIKEQLPNAKICLFGSRARNDNKPKSDIDLAIDIGQKIESQTMSKIKENIEECIIPFTVDIVDINNVQNDFKIQILKDCMVWKI